MKTIPQVKRQLKQIAFRHRQRHVRSGLAVKPCNCVHNEVVEFKSPDRLHQIRRCTYKEGEVSLEKRVCDEGFGGLKQAQNCPYFQQKNNPESLKKEFDGWIGLDGSKTSTNFLAHTYPDIMALYWVLGPPEEVEDKNPLTETPVSENPEFLLFMSSFLDE